MSRTPRALRLVVALVLLCGTAQAALPPCPVTVGDVCPAGVPDLLGARALAMGAYRGVAAGNDGIFLNAASLAARRRYSIEANWLLERVSSDTAFQALGASVVDSETTSVTSGIAYTRVMSGPWIGNAFHVPLAFSVTSSLFLGVTGKYLSIDGPGGDAMRSGNVDLSAFYRATGGFGVGVAGYNLLDMGHVTQQPRGLGVGLSYGDDRKYHVAADWRADFQRRGSMTNLFAFGGEVLVADSIPIRASYLNDETRNASFWSVGAGVVSASGLALDLAYRQAFERSDDRTLAATVKIFLAAQ